MEPETCKKCGTTYENPAEGFYWEKRKHGWRKPCKKCIAKYNQQEKQKKKRYAANQKYRKTEKGKESIARAHANKMKKYWNKKRRLDI